MEIIHNGPLIMIFSYHPPGDQNQIKIYKKALPPEIRMIG